MRIKLTLLKGFVIIVGLSNPPLMAQNATNPTVTKEVQIDYNKSKNTFPSTEKTKLIKTGLRFESKSWPDSTITYTASGEFSSKTLYEYNDALIIKKTYQWESNKWSDNYDYSESSETVIEPRVFIDEYGDFYFSGPFNKLYGRGFGFTSSGYKYKVTPTYDSNGNLTHINMQYYAIDNPDVLYPSYQFVITYNSANKPLSISSAKGTGEEWLKVEYKYDLNGRIVYFNYLDFNNETNTWYNTAKYENEIMVEMSNYWDEIKTKTITKADSNKNMYTEQFYTLINNKWYMTHYTIYYPNSLSSNAEIENSTSVGSKNQGSFDLTVNIPTDSIQSGSLVVQLPDGFTLDKSNTSLTANFTKLFDLTITKQENNSWLINITPKSSKSAVLKANEAGTILHIAYLVDERVQKNTYDIILNSIQFETPKGNIIPEPIITTQVNVNRWALGNELIENSNTTVYIKNKTLYIETDQTEQVAIYTTNGVKVYGSIIQSGTTTVNMAFFPQGVLIIKGSSDWTKKVINN